MPPIDFKQLETLATAGSIYSYNADFEKARITRPKKLPLFTGEVDIGSLMTVQDPIIQKLAQEGKADVFCTDVALAALMCASKA